MSNPFEAIQAATRDEILAVAKAWYGRDPGFPRESLMQIGYDIGSSNHPWMHIAPMWLTEYRKEQALMVEMAEVPHD